MLFKEGKENQEAEPNYELTAKGKLYAAIVDYAKEIGFKDDNSECYSYIVDIIDNVTKELKDTICVE